MMENPSSSLRLDNPLPDGIAHQLGARVQVELAHDILAVTLDRFGADHQRGGGMITGWKIE